MNEYEAKCRFYSPTVEPVSEDVVCCNYDLKKDAPYGSCIFCRFYSPRMEKTNVSEVER